MSALSTSSGVLIQDPATGRAYRVPAERLEEFAVEGEVQPSSGVTTLVLPGDDVIEELPTMRRAMLQTGS
ncbi:hypothetical protein SAMN05216266_10411 [Amycolatopsis marina]|uniref:Uncharacterized protein n=1 Tax=Amycolatopsis marina TaxID=490629 RepID=A0A1I0XTX7_9PSEU|nr:hypothetical protein [Amycolatopsis marina]SFB04599.1 hypothetical protein SAMN05216266_10411 [Amycolatopsis marina]